MTHARLAHVPDMQVTITDRFKMLSDSYPNIKWVMAHSAGSAHTDAINASSVLPNVYMETCGSHGTVRALEDCVAGAGEENILFGTDIPLLDPRHQIAKVLTAKISEKAKRRILGLNAIELLGLEC